MPKNNKTIAFAELYTVVLETDAGELPLKVQTGSGIFGGITAIKGDKGDAPEHAWDGARLQFRTPAGEWGNLTDLLGPKGDTGAQAAFGSDPVGHATPATVGDLYFAADGDVHRIDGAGATTVIGKWYNQALADELNAAKDTAVAAASSSSADATQTAADRVQTGLDRIATDADATQTNADRAAVLSDKNAAETAKTDAQTAAGTSTTQAGIATTKASEAAASATSAGQSETQSGLDAAATAADRVQTGQDATATAADRVQTAQDRVATAADKTASETAMGRSETARDQAEAAAATYITDHGALTGLADDDHPQYHNDARGDARYKNPAVAANNLTNLAGNWHTFVNDGGGNLGQRWNATPNANPTLVENGSAWKIEISNDSVDGDFVLGRGTTASGLAGEAITWTGHFKIEGSTGRAVFLEGVDTPFSPVNGEGIGNRNYNDLRYAPVTHTHTESQITDLDKYTKAEADTNFLPFTGGTLTGGIVINNTAPSIQLIESDVNGISGAGGVTNMVGSSNSFYMQHRAYGGGAANNFLQVKYIDESNEVDYWTFRQGVGNTVRARMDYTDSVDLPSAESILTRIRADTRYLQDAATDVFRMRDFNGDFTNITSAGSYKYVGTASSGGPNDGVAYWHTVAVLGGDTGDTNKQRSLIDIQHGGGSNLKMHIGRTSADGTVPDEWKEVVTQELGDASYLQLSGGGISGNLDIEPAAGAQTHLRLQGISGISNGHVYYSDSDNALMISSKDALGDGARWFQFTPYTQSLQGTSVLRKQDADGLYAQLGVANTLTGDLALNGVGDTALTVKSVSGAGDSDAILNLDAFDTGESQVLFHNNGVQKADVTWVNDSAQLNISTAAGTNGAIDLQANAQLVARFLPHGLVGGRLVSFYDQSGVTCGHIGVQDTDIWIGEGDVGLQFQLTGSDRIDPFNTNTNVVSDNLIDLGGAASRFDDVYATNGVIQTSDAAQKTDITATSEAEARVAKACKGLLKKYRWKDAVATKGDDARWHFGIIAQDLEAAFAAEDLDAGKYGMFTSTAVPDENGVLQYHYGVRYPELLAFIISAI